MTNTETLNTKADSLIRMIDRVTIIHGEVVGLAETMKAIFDGDAPNDAETVKALLEAESDCVGDEELDNYADDEEAQELWAEWSNNAEFRAVVVAKVIAINAASLARIAEANKD
jgi:cytochrome c556